MRINSEYVIKGLFSSLTFVYVCVTYNDTLDSSPTFPLRTEWDVCWPMATWYISWHMAICLSVVSLPSRLFKLEVDDCNVPRGPDWRRLTILLLWYLAGVPVAYVMHDPCSVGAPETWARATRVFIEGIVAFGLGGFIYVGIFPFLTAHWGDIYLQFPTHVYRYSPHLKRPPLFYQAGPNPLVLRNSCNNVLLGKGYHTGFYHSSNLPVPSHKRTGHRILLPHVKYRVSPHPQGDNIELTAEVTFYPKKHVGIS